MAPDALPPHLKSAAEGPQARSWASQHCGRGMNLSDSSFRKPFWGVVSGPPWDVVQTYHILTHRCPRALVECLCELRVQGHPIVSQARAELARPASLNCADDAFVMIAHGNCWRIDWKEAAWTSDLDCTCSGVGSAGVRVQGRGEVESACVCVGGWVCVVVVWVEWRGWRRRRWWVVNDGTWGGCMVYCRVSVLYMSGASQCSALSVRSLLKGRVIPRTPVVTVVVTLQESTTADPESMLSRLRDRLFAVLLCPSRTNCTVSLQSAPMHGIATQLIVHTRCQTRRPACTRRAFSLSRVPVLYGSYSSESKNQGPISHCFSDGIVEENVSCNVPSKSYRWNSSDNFKRDLLVRISQSRSDEPVCNRFTDRCIVIVDRHYVQYDTKILKKRKGEMGNYLWYDPKYDTNILKKIKNQRWEVVFQIVFDEICNFLCFVTFYVSCPFNIFSCPLSLRTSKLWLQDWLVLITYDERVLSKTIPESNNIFFICVVFDRIALIHTSYAFRVARIESEGVYMMESWELSKCQLQWRWRRQRRTRSTRKFEIAIPFSDRSSQLWFL